MKNSTLFIAPLGARNRKETLFREIVSLHPDNDFSKFLYLAPNNAVLADARNRFFSYMVQNLRKSAYIPFQALTIRQLAEGLYEGSGKGSVITDRTMVLILCEILKEKNIGYATVLADLSKKIRHYLPDRELPQVKEDTGKLIVEQRAAERAVKAIEVLEKYRDELRRKNLVDAEEVLQESINRIRMNVGRRASGVEREKANDARRSTLDVFTLVVDGFFDPTPLELEIIKALSDRSDNALILTEENAEIIKNLESCKKGMIIKKITSSASRKKTGYSSYPSVEEEVEGIAKNIRKLLIDGIKPWEITVCFPVLSKYITMLGRIFRKYGIPASIGEKRLSSTRPFTALEEMMVCIEGDYSRSNFLSFLTSPHFPAISETVRERALSYSYRAGIIKGRDSWLSIRETLLHSLKDEISEEDRELLNEFQAGIKRIIETFESIKNTKEPGLFIDAFESALQNFGFFDSLETESVQHGEMISSRINDQLSEFRFFAGLYKDSGQKASPVFYLRYLLSNLKISGEDRDGVKVLPFELAAGLETEVLFFGGMLEGDFPSRPDIDPILPERVKKELGIPHLEYYLNRQKQYFMRLLNVPVRDPYFSCPSAEGDKIFLPSPFLDWENVIPSPGFNIFSEEEALLREGAIKMPEQHPGIFSDSKMFRTKKEYALLQQRIGRISKGFFGVTNIDFYRKCPLRFYIEKILGLEVITPPQFEIEARLWGSLAHMALEHLFKDGDVEPEKMEEKLLQGLEKGLKHFPIGSFWAKLQGKFSGNSSLHLKSRR